VKRSSTPGEAKGRDHLKAKEEVSLCGHHWIHLQVNPWLAGGIFRRILGIVSG